MWAGGGTHPPQPQRTWRRWGTTVVLSVLPARLLQKESLSIPPFAQTAREEWGTGVGGTHLSHKERGEGGARSLRAAWSALLQRTWCASGLHEARIDGHAGDGVDAHAVEFFDFGMGADTAGDDELFRGAGAEDGGDIYGETGKGAFRVHMGVEEGGAVVFEPGHGFFGGQVDGIFPAFYSDAAVPGIDAEDELFFAQCFAKTLCEVEIEDRVALTVSIGVATEEGGTVDDPLRAEVEHALTVCSGAQAAAHLTGKPASELFDERLIGALPQGGIKVDELYQRVLAEALDPVIEVVKGELELFALDELDDLTVHEVDGWDEHVFMVATRCESRAASEWLAGLRRV